MLYKSKQDGWVVGLAVIACVAIFGGAGIATATAIYSREPLLVIPAFALAAVGAMLIWARISAWSEITAGTVEIRFGPFRWSVPLESVADVQSTNRLILRPAWGLAWSLDRLYVKCRDRLLPFCISPCDKAAFVAELQRAQPHVTFSER